MDRELVGDPLEQAMLKAVEWDLSKGRKHIWCNFEVISYGVQYFK